MRRVWTVPLYLSVALPFLVIYWKSENSECIWKWSPAIWFHENAAY